MPYNCILKIRKCSSKFATASANGFTKSAMITAFIDMEFRKLFCFFVFFAMFYYLNHCFFPFFLVFLDKYIIAYICYGIIS